MGDFKRTPEHEEGPFPAAETEQQEQVFAQKVSFEAHPAEGEPFAHQSKEASDPGPAILSVPPHRFSPGAARVLDAALQIRRQRKEQQAWLSASALLFGITETGRASDVTSGAGVARWLSERIQDRAEHEKLLAEYLQDKWAIVPRSSEEVTLDLAKVSRSPNLVNLLAAASSLAREASRTEVIDTVHLLSVLLVHSPATRESNSFGRLQRSGLEPKALRRDLLAFVQAERPGDDLNAWSETLSEPRPLPPVERLPPGYSPDGTGDVDVLDRTEEIGGFASVIASTDLVPPLSIGLFGSWGSGKSFFMRKLRAAIAQRSKEAAPGKPGEGQFHQSIVSIEFNAWHYAEANLWASLVEHVFQELSSYLTRRGAEDGAKKLFAELETAQQLQKQTEDELAQAQEKQKLAKSALETTIDEERSAASSLKSLLSKDVWKEIALSTLVDESKAPKRTRKRLDDAASTLGVPTLASSARDLKQVVDDARSPLQRARLVTSSLQNQPPPRRALVLLIVALPVVALGASLVAAKLSTGNGGEMAAGLVSSLSLLLGSVVTWIKQGIAHASKVLDGLEEADALVTKAFTGQEAKRRDAVEAKEKELEKAKSTVASAAQQLEHANERVRAAERALEEARPEKRIARFIQERVGSDDYRKHLGLIATIRRDFERLSELMYPEKDSLTGKLPPPKEGIPRIDRIVLYIDDLDRCPPARVVEVLEAVHLLLAFKLFVVIVGVDSHWVSRSLLERFPVLLGAKAQEDAAVLADPQDYLEKIFQVPFWIRPLDSDDAFKLIHSLLQPSEKAPSEEEEAPAPAPKEEDQAPTLQAAATPTEPSAGAPTLPKTEQEGAPPASPPAKPATAPVAKVEKADVKGPARRIAIEHWESEFMQALSPFIGRSPRRVKRFVNIYRLFKASLPASSNATYLKRGGGPGAYQAILVLFALSTGAPHLSPDLLRALATQPSTMLLRDFVKTIAPRKEGNGALEAEHRNALGAFALLLQTQGDDVTLADLVCWVPDVGRYSFSFASPALPGTSSPLS